MAEQHADALTAADEDDVDMTGLLRLGAWGLGAAVALVTVVIASQTDIGGKRVVVAMNSFAGTPAARPTGAQLLAAAQETENDPRRVADTVRRLSAERDRLATRVGTLERNFEDLTGSIARQPPPSIPSPSVTPAIPVIPPAASQLPALPTTEPPTTATANASTPAQSLPPLPVTSSRPAGTMAAAPAEDVPLPKPAPRADVPTGTLLPASSILSPKPLSPNSRPVPDATPTGSIPERTAPTPNASAIRPQAPAPLPGVEVTPPQGAQTRAAPQAETPAPAAPKRQSRSPSARQPAPVAQLAPNARAVGSTASKTEFAIDLGSASNVEGLRKLWTSVRGNQRNLIGELQPLIVVREGAEPADMQLRLVAGPLTDAAAAARLCAQFSSAGRNCEPAVYDGQKLAPR